MREINHENLDGQAADAAAIEGVDSISEILRMPVVHILGQQSYLSGGQAAVRVIVTDAKNEPIAGPSSVRIKLAPEGRQASALFAGPLNARRTAEAQFRFPAGLVGSYALRFVAETPIGEAEFTQQVRLEDKVSILAASGDKSPRRLKPALQGLAPVSSLWVGCRPILTDPNRPGTRRRQAPIPPLLVSYI